jgi:hypothetical protein
VLSTAADTAFAEEEERITELLRRSLGDLAALHVTFTLRKGTAAGVLLAAAIGAQLLVLDSPRSGSLATLPKSWIVPQVVLRSPCPVVLMPPVAEPA